jgi:hypothetical protein
MGRCGNLGRGITGLFMLGAVIEVASAALNCNSLPYQGPLRKFGPWWCNRSFYVGGCN